MNIQTISNKTIPVLKTYGVKKAALFGSMASGDYEIDSDIDLLVELVKEMSLFDFIGLKQDLENVLQKKVDLVQYDKIKSSLKKSILDHEKVFYQL